MLSEFALSAVADAQPAWMKLLNIESSGQAAWVMLGLAGQGMFVCRMGVQWIVSERRKESVVPPVFWWLSLVGAAMLLSYFLWRLDIVGILGQSFGFLVYGRNLWLIYVRARTPLVTADVDPEPELDRPVVTGRRPRRH
ncbi:MAG: lipid-A-disaccharide synthase N-terminal domain-containing protein [Planctomycetota bacterium]|jgi:lipid-A-disaccharide synthase-like uncharacterized protein